VEGRGAARRSMVGREEEGKRKKRRGYRHLVSSDMCVTQSRSSREEGCMGVRKGKRGREAENKKGEAPPFRRTCVCQNQEHRASSRHPPSVLARMSHACRISHLIYATEIPQVEEKHNGRRTKRARET